MLTGLPCFFHRLTGLYCPGCGITRAAVFLLMGRFIKSLQYHPLVLYTVAVVFYYTARKASLRTLYVQGRFQRYLEINVYMGIAIILVNCLIKNYMLIVKGIDLLP